MKHILTSAANRLAVVAYDNEDDPEQYEKVKRFLQVIGVPGGLQDHIASSLPDEARIDKRDVATLRKGIASKLGQPSTVRSQFSDSIFYIWRIRGKGQVVIESYKNRSFSFVLEQGKPEGPR